MKKKNEKTIEIDNDNVFGYDACIIIIINSVKLMGDVKGWECVHACGRVINNELPLKGGSGSRVVIKAKCL